MSATRSDAYSPTSQRRLGVGVFTLLAAGLFAGISAAAAVALVEHKTAFGMFNLLPSYLRPVAIAAGVLLGLVCMFQMLHFTGNALGLRPLLRLNRDAAGTATLVFALPADVRRQRSLALSSAAPVSILLERDRYQWPAFAVDRVTIGNAHGEFSNRTFRLISDSDLERLRNLIALAGYEVLTSVVLHTGSRPRKSSRGKRK